MKRDDAMSTALPFARALVKYLAQTKGLKVGERFTAEKFAEFATSSKLPANDVLAGKLDAIHTQKWIDELPGGAGFALTAWGFKEGASKS